MAFEVPLTEPDEIIAGDLVTWKRVLADFPASTWTLAYYLRSDTGGDAETVTAAASGDDHLVSEAAATTASWVVGTYYWTARVTSGSSIHTICEGVFKIKSDPAVVTTSDDRSDAKIIYDALIAAFKTRATRPEKQYSLQAAGRSFTFHTLDEWQKAIGYWKSIVDAETAQDLADKGKPTGNRILTYL